MSFSQDVSEPFLSWLPKHVNIILNYFRCFLKNYTTRFIFWSRVMAPIYSQPRLAASQQAEIYFFSPWHHVYQATPASLSGTTCTLIKSTKQGAPPQSVRQPFTNLLL